MCDGSNEQAMIGRLPGDEIDVAGMYIAEVISGANDGTVTTFAAVAGVARVTFATGVGLGGFA